LQRAYADLQQNGTTTAAVPVFSFTEFNKLMGLDDVREFERRYAEDQEVNAGLASASEDKGFAT
jgi:2,3-dimethylmalate lyase